MLEATSLLSPNAVVRRRLLFGSFADRPVRWTHYHARVALSGAALVCLKRKEILPLKVWRRDDQTGNEPRDLHDQDPFRCCGSLSLQSVPPMHDGKKGKGDADPDDNDASVSVRREAEGTQHVRELSIDNEQMAQIEKE
jgi:hypothetical protein